MRMLIWTIIFFVIAAVIKIDLEQGTLPLASFYEEEACNDVIYETVTVKIAENDTIHSLFATTPMENEIPFSQRLTLFFKYNPHLQHQSLVAGEEVMIPIKQINKCE